MSDESFHGVSVRTDEATDARLAVLAAKLDATRGHAARVALIAGLDAIDRGYPIPTVQRRRRRSHAATE